MENSVWNVIKVYSHMEMRSFNPFLNASVAGVPDPNKQKTSLRGKPAKEFV